MHGNPGNKPTRKMHLETFAIKISIEKPFPSGNLGIFWCLFDPPFPIPGKLAQLSFEMLRDGVRASC
jgi:hypothetical protein